MWGGVSKKDKETDGLTINIQNICLNYVLSCSGIVISMTVKHNGY